MTLRIDGTLLGVQPSEPVAPVEPPDLAGAQTTRGLGSSEQAREREAEAGPVATGVVVTGVVVVEPPAPFPPQTGVRARARDAKAAPAAPVPPLQRTAPLSLGAPAQGASIVEQAPLPALVVPASPRPGSVEEAPLASSVPRSLDVAEERHASSVPHSLSAFFVDILRYSVTDGEERERGVARRLTQPLALRERAPATAPRTREVEAPVAPGPPSSVMSSAVMSSAMSERTFELLNHAFSAHAGPESQLDAARLGQALKVRNQYLAERMLAALDRDGDGVVGRAEFLHGVRRLVFGTTRDKLRLAFRIHDLDGDSMLDHGEVERMIMLNLIEEQPAALAQEAERLTTLLFEAADRDGDGRLSFGDFEVLMARHPAVLQSITQSEARWIAPSGDLLAPRSRPPGPGRFRRALANRGATLLLVGSWACVSVGLFAEAVLRYHARGFGPWVCLARGCGAAINFNGALILLPVMRRFYTRLRRVPVLRRLPLDDSIAFHRTIGLTLFALALVHSGAHLANYSLGPLGIGPSLLTRAGATGAALLAIFCVIWWFSRRSVRQSGKFELFHFTHLLYLPWLALAFVHGPHYWMWAGVPLLGFLLELAWRHRRAAKPAEVCEAEVLRSGVTRLTLRRPAGFAHRAGDYLFLKVPAIAPHEWHPFTISSAPERQHLTLHVRSLGNFTRALQQLIEKQPIRRPGPPLGVLIDGPYGTASGAILESRHAVLICAGIGVTPFASVLESTVLRSRARTSRLEKVHFFWLNRDVQPFEWFGELLMQLEALDEHERIDINIFTTEASASIIATALNLARELSHDLGNPDLMTGLRAQTRIGLPDWGVELSRIRALHAPCPVDVFFCGPPALGRQIRQACGELGLPYRQEHF
ncbi:MAG TPA: ferric reductase-like transmembrane domain-containing protein [Polyangiaceae bacterium]|nr:ferric reductase-like transmembrane domain-containing protein [Polyangiaceae bacterium]